MALEENKYDHLVELGGSDFEIVDGEPDIRGWSVKNQLGQQIGEVDELLFDPNSRKVRYLVVDLDDNELDLDDDKKVLVPIGIASLYDDGHLQDSETRVSEETEIDARVDSNTDLPGNIVDIYDPSEDGEVVIVPVNADQLRQLPAYKKGNITPDIESSVRRVFEGSAPGGMGTYNRDNFYLHDHFDEERFYDRNRFPVANDPLDAGKTDRTRITNRPLDQPLAERDILRNSERIDPDKTDIS